MYVTVESVKNAISNANEVVSSIVNNYAPPTIKEIKITNATSYWALISKDRKSHNTYSLRVSRVFNLIGNEERAQRRLEECMIHELVHTLPKCWNHGPYFQMYASKINQKFTQYHIQTNTSDQEAGIEEIPVKRAPKYLSTCKKCGKVYNWFRKPKYDINLYCCSICGGRLTLDEISKQNN